MDYPFHLGVTEAGSGVEARVKSAAGIGTLLDDGIGDTIRVSLAEEPEAEIPVARRLADLYTGRRAPDRLAAVSRAPVATPVEARDPFSYGRRSPIAVRIGRSRSAAACRRSWRTRLRRWRPERCWIGCSLGRRIAHLAGPPRGEPRGPGRVRSRARARRGPRRLGARALQVPLIAVPPAARLDCSSRQGPTGSRSWFGRQKSSPRRRGCCDELAHVVAFAAVRQLPLWIEADVTHGRGRDAGRDRRAALGSSCGVPPERRAERQAHPGCERWCSESAPTRPLRDDPRRAVPRGATG